MRNIRGLELKTLAKKTHLRSIEICSSAGISQPTLYKVYKNEGTQEYEDLVRKAINYLISKIQEIKV